MSPTKYLEQLRAQGHIQESQPLSHAGLQASRAGMSTLDQTIQAEAQIAPPPQSSWRHDVVLPPQPPRRVFVKMPNTSMPKTSLPPVFCFGGLEPGATVGDLVELLWEQLKPGPSTLIRLEHWGSALDESKTLLSCAIADDSSLRLRLVEHTPSEERGLSRLRVTSTALQTRAVAIASRSWTGLDLKERLCAQLGALLNGPPSGLYSNGPGDGFLRLRRRFIVGAPANTASLYVTSPVATFSIRISQVSKFSSSQ